MNEFYLRESFPSYVVDRILDNKENLIAILNEELQHKWSYEVKNVVVGKGSYMVTVTVYLPGTIRDGIAIESAVDDALASAIYCAIKTLKLPKQQPKQAEPAPVTNETVEATTTVEDATTQEPIVDSEYEKQLANRMKRFGITREEAILLAMAYEKLSIKSNVDLDRHCIAFGITIAELGKNVDMFYKMAMLENEEFMPEEDGLYATAED